MFRTEGQTATEPGPLPSHIEDTVAAIAELHLQHKNQTTRPQLWAARFVRIFGRTRALFLMAAGVLAWIAANMILPLAGRAAFDPPPFSGLADIASVAGVFFTLLILITQRRDDDLSRRWEQLTLQLSFLSERKAAKAIELLEELRRDHPGIHNRKDIEAEEMAKPTDAQFISDIKEIQPDLE